MGQRSDERERPNVLLVYGLLQHPLRQWQRDHLRSFREYGSARYFYVNLAARRLPSILRRVRFDAVLFHHTFTDQRFEPRLFERHVGKALPLRELAPRRVTLISDDYIHSEAISSFVERLGISDAFSVAPASQWPKLYPRLSERVRFHQMLPGYLDEHSVDRIDRIVAEQGAERPIDVGYRSSPGDPSLGRHGRMRERLADAFASACRARGLEADISTDPADTIHGDEWFRYLASCRYLIGSEGGSSLHDPRGEIRACVARHLAAHPDASFEEVEKACFPGRDGELELFAISPRHLEACATRTCQVLVEGEYSGVLRAGEHYIALRRDLSNLDDVLDAIQRDDERERITEAAYRDVVASGRWGYRGLVETIERESGIAGAEPLETSEVLVRRAHAAAERADRRAWVKVAVGVRAVRALRRLGGRRPS